MTETSYAVVPAGWYPDPRGTKQRRWWDGQSWTHALEAPPEPVAPATPAYANLPGPGAPGYAHLPGPAFGGAGYAAQASRTPSPSAPTVHRALDSDATVHEPLPTRRQLREAAALLEAQRLADEPAAPSPVYAMGPAVSSTQQPEAAFATRQLTDDHMDAAESPALSTIAATSLTETTLTETHNDTVHTETSHTESPARAMAQTFAPVSASPIGATHTFVPTAQAARTEPAPMPSAAPAYSPASLPNGPAYQPFGMSPKITTGTMEAPTSVNTSSVWLIAVLPSVALGIAVALIRFAPEFYTPFTQGALAFVFAIAGVALAVNDRRKLVLRSHQDTASPAWILLTPLAYLAARATNTKRQAGRGWAPALVFVLLTAAGAALVYFSGLPIETFVVV